MVRILLWLTLALGLAACGGAESKWASDAEVQAARYSPGPPTTVTLFTVISNRGNNGAHSGLLINGSERVLFDPAGTWYHPNLPERNDVHFGMTDRAIAFYIDYHARKTYRVLQQTVPVSPEVAELVMARAKAYGAVPKAQCANSITSILRGVPGFEAIPASWYPLKLSDAFGTLPGATSRVITDVDDDSNHGVLMVQANGDPFVE
jgi:hypothetical protein